MVDNSSSFGDLSPCCIKCGVLCKTNQATLKEETSFIEFRAHKCILAARSPVFKAMFNYKLKETLTSRVVIEDCRPEVIRAMLKYIYTAYLPPDADIGPIACDLYIAAEKYFIESLKIKCREYLVEHLSMDTAIQTYIVAELYNDAMLRKQALKFINENIDRVTQNPDWNEFMAFYPQFFTNALIRICKKDF
jgi:speckle-type POZ protein